MVALRRFQASRILASSSRPCWESICAITGGSILIDGLDEIPEEASELLRRSIDELVDAYPLWRVLATSDTAAYRRRRDKLHGFAAVPLCPFTPAQIDASVEAVFTASAHARRPRLSGAQPD